MITATVWHGTESKLGQIEVADLMREENAIGVMLSVKTAEGVFAAQVDLLDAAELIAALVHAVSTQHATMGVDYVCP